MRLLHTKDLVFKEFIGSNIPKYAIVSHRWADDEVTYHHFDTARRDQHGHTGSYGWTKITQACRIGSERGLEWVWIDTCCIDKKSSAELTEAINSMFDWYGCSEECFVFLPDVGPRSDDAMRSVGYPPVVSFDPEEFKSSVWFQRAWTLQELLAPEQLLFYDRSFNFIGSKEDLLNLISETTRIPTPFLTGDLKLHNASVAERMKWAAMRQATREEDIAYALLGLFGVNMPLLYGEGNKAFLRLQKEIIAVSDDETIFGWIARPFDDGNGLLARNISSFSNINDLRRGYRTDRQHYGHHYELTNKGIRMTLLLEERRLDAAFKTSDETIVFLRLNCTEYRHAGEVERLKLPFGILVILRRTTDSLYPYSQLTRMYPVTGDRISPRPIRTTIELDWDKLDSDGAARPVVRDHDGSPVACDLVSPGIREDCINLPVYFSTGW